MYVVGCEDGPNWRIEKRLLTTGALDTGFGTNGVIAGDSASYEAYGVSIDSTSGYVYVVGCDGTSDWRIEKRLLTTGALDNNFGTGGVVTGDSGSYEAKGISIDSTYMYVVGSSYSDLRIEKRLLTTGALDNNFGTSGVIAGDSESYEANNISIDSTYMYVVGHGPSYHWRIEKRLLTTGHLADGTKLGMPLADNNTEAEMDEYQDLRLKILLHVSGYKIQTGEKIFKLQYGKKSSSSEPCSSVTYSDVTSTSTIAFKDLGLVNASDVEATTTDPTHGTDTIIRQGAWNSNTNITARYLTNAGEDLLFDFSLFNNNAPDGVYCFRVVETDNTLLNTYTQYPAISYYSTVATAVSYSSSSWSIELGSGGGVLITGGEEGGDDSTEDPDGGGGTTTDGGTTGGGGEASP